jgi:hypothetical protein
MTLAQALQSRAKPAVHLSNLDLGAGRFTGDVAGTERRWPARSRVEEPEDLPTKVEPVGARKLTEV